VIFTISTAAMAQPENQPAVEGYITAVSSANEFSVNGRLVLTTAGTSYGIQNGSTVTKEIDLRLKVQAARSGGQ